jgi:AGCS family alanine or glycine:cation symporter
MNPINHWLFYLLVVLLLGVGLYFTLRFGFLQLRALPHSVRMLWQKADHEGITSFQAFAIGLASRVGTGHIAGVAVALTAGGPGAVFWMWVTAFLGMASAFVESTLAQLFKTPHGDGTFRGGPAYYIRFGLNSRWLSRLFALVLILTAGFAFNAVQANSIAEAFEHAFGWQRALTGALLALLITPIIFGGVRRVARLVETVVPVMTLGYVVLAGYVVLQNLPALPGVFSLIVKSAFGLQQAVGGFAGYTLSQAMMVGIKRGLFSNEAGMGTAPNAAATAVTRHPVTQGLLQMLGVMVDTFVICTATALMILASGQYEAGIAVEGAALTQRALASAVGDWGGVFMAGAIFCFAWSTIIGHYVYLEGNLAFLSRNRILLLLFRLAAPAVVIAGSLGSVSQVWRMADVSMALMATINLMAIVPLSKYALAAWRDYQAQRKNGIKEPAFSLDAIPELAKRLPQGVWPGTATVPVAKARRRRKHPVKSAKAWKPVA